MRLKESLIVVSMLLSIGIVGVALWSRSTENPASSAILIILCSVAVLTGGTALTMSVSVRAPGQKVDAVGGDGGSVGAGDGVRGTRGHEALRLLALLQERGRFIDFAMEDITSYSDEQVGAAARVVHSGCRAVIKECFDPTPVSSTPENAPVVIDKDYTSEEFHISGDTNAGPPYDGTVVHQGWRARHINLPQESANGSTFVIVPARVEI